MTIRNSSTVVVDSSFCHTSVVSVEGSRVGFSDDFIRGFEMAAGKITGLKRPVDLFGSIHPGKDVDVLVEHFVAACAYLEKCGFIASVRIPQNPDNRLYSFYYRGISMLPIQIHIYRFPCWGRAWRWKGRISQQEAKWVGDLLEKRSFGQVKQVAEVWCGRTLSPVVLRLLQLTVAVRSKLLAVVALGFLGLRLSPSALITAIAIGWRRCYWLMLHRIGIEIGFAGVDGSGKSTLVGWLEKKLCAPIRRIYMGNSGYVTLLARFLDRVGYRGPFWLLIVRCDQSVRRVCGIVLAKRARIVLYDRDPTAVPKYTGCAWKRAIMWPFDTLLGKPVDMAVFLDGDLKVFHQRKEEHDPEKLGELRNEIVQGYREHGAMPWIIDSTAESVDSIGEKVAERISDLYLSRMRALADYAYGRHPVEVKGVDT